MKFGLPDPSDSDESLYDGYSSSEDEIRPEPIGILGRTIRVSLESSDEEPPSSDEHEAMDSEDEVELIGMEVPSNKPKYREPKLRESKLSRLDIYPQAESSKAPWRRLAKSVQGSVTRETQQYTSWLKTSEEESMRQGYEVAQQRRTHLRQIAQNARTEIQRVEDARLAKDQEDMERMLRGIALKQHDEEEEINRQFAEREKRLWLDIDAAIAEVERKEAELKAAAAAMIKKKQEEEAARAAAAKKEAQTRRVEAERLAKEHVERQKREQEQKAARLKKEEEDRQRAEELEKKMSERGRVGAEWRRWTEKQKWMKKEVIEPVKADRELKTGLRMGMRLITRGLGQVVNTRESVVRVTTDLHKILCEQLPSEPSPANIVTLDQAPKSYSYLLSHTSKALIKQAETEVSAKTEAAFPLARIVVGLLLRGHAAVGDVLLARFVKKCPWIIPFYPSRREGQAREEYEKSTGRGVDESLSDYVSRMSGITTLYFGILQTPLGSLIPTIPMQPSPDQLEAIFAPALRFPSAWTWLSNALKDPTAGMPPIASMVSTWTKLMAAECAKLYGPGQMAKVFEAMKREGVEGGKIKGDSEAARVGLGLTLDKWQTLGVPSGRDWE